MNDDEGGIFTKAADRTIHDRTVASKKLIQILEQMEKTPRGTPEYKLAAADLCSLFNEGTSGSVSSRISRDGARVTAWEEVSPAPLTHMKLSSATVEVDPSDGLPFIEATFRAPKGEVETYKYLDPEALLAFALLLLFGGVLAVEDHRGFEYLRLNIMKSPRDIRPYGLRLIVGTEGGWVTKEMAGKDYRRKKLGGLKEAKPGEKPELGRDQAIEGALAQYDGEPYVPEGIPDRETYRAVLKRAFVLLDAVPLGSGPGVRAAPDNDDPGSTIDAAE